MKTDFMNYQSESGKFFTGIISVDFRSNGAGTVKLKE